MGHVNIQKLTSIFLCDSQSMHVFLKNLHIKQQSQFIPKAQLQLDACVVNFIKNPFGKSLFVIVNAPILDMV